MGDVGLNLLREMPSTSLYWSDKRTLPQHLQRMFSKRITSGALRGMSLDGAPVLWEVSKGGHGGQHFVPETKRFKPCWKKTLQTSPSLQGFH